MKEINYRGFSMAHSDSLTTSPISSVMYSISIPMTISRNANLYACSIIPLSEGLSRKRRQHKRRLMDLLAIVFAQLFLFLCAPRPNRLPDITVGVLAADHEANLTGRIGRNGRVRILGDGEDFFAGLFQLRDEAEVQPLVLSYSKNTGQLDGCTMHGAVASCIQREVEVLVWTAQLASGWGEGLTTLRGNHTTFSQSVIQQLKIRFLEERLCGSFRVRGIGNDDIKLVFLVLEEFESIADVHFDGGVLEANRHARQVFLGQANDGFVNVAEDRFFDGLMLHDFTEDTAISTAYHKDLFGVGMRIHGEVRDHFLISMARISAECFALKFQSL